VPIRSGIWPVVDRYLVAAAHRLELPVHVWTVNEVRTMHELLDLGVDGIITDALASLRAVLAERGAWHGG
jgi:glycerophosphoryl diester phosphodiesterase